MSAPCLCVSVRVGRGAHKSSTDSTATGESHVVVVDAAALRALRHSAASVHSALQSRGALLPRQQRKTVYTSPLLPGANWQGTRSAMEWIRSKGSWVLPVELRREILLVDGVLRRNRAQQRAQKHFQLVDQLLRKLCHLLCVCRAMAELLLHTQHQVQPLLEVNPSHLTAPSPQLLFSCLTVLSLVGHLIAEEVLPACESAGVALLKNVSQGLFLPVTLTLYSAVSRLYTLFRVLLLTQLGDLTHPILQLYCAMPAHSVHVARAQTDEALIPGVCLPQEWVGCVCLSTEPKCLSDVLPDVERVQSRGSKDFPFLLGQEDSLQGLILPTAPLVRILRPGPSGVRHRRRNRVKLTRKERREEQILGKKRSCEETVGPGADEEPVPKVRKLSRRERRMRKQKEGLEEDQQQAQSCLPQQKVEGKRQSAASKQQQVVERAVREADLRKLVGRTAIPLEAAAVQVNVSRRETEGAPSSSSECPQEEERKTAGGGKLQTRTSAHRGRQKDTPPVKGKSAMESIFQRLLGKS